MSDLDLVVEAAQEVVKIAEEVRSLFNGVDYTIEQSLINVQNAFASFASVLEGAIEDREAA